MPPTATAVLPTATGTSRGPGRGAGREARRGAAGGAGRAARRRAVAPCVLLRGGHQTNSLPGCRCLAPCVVSGSVRSRAPGASCAASFTAARRCAERRARIRLDLRGRGRDGATCQELGLGLVPALADGQLGRADAARARSARNRFTRRSSSEWKLIAPKPAADAQQVPRGREGPVERVELAVHGDPERLEGPLGGMAAAEAVRRRNGVADRRRPARRWSRTAAGRRSRARSSAAWRSSP